MLAEYFYREKEHTSIEHGVQRISRNIIVYVFQPGPKLFAGHLLAEYNWAIKVNNSR